MFNIHQDRPLVNPFSYTPGILQALETALSAERLTAYLRVTGGDRERALRLYLWNTEISAAFYGPLQGLEVALRNALHRELARVFGTSWYDAPAMPLASRAQDLIREAKAAIAHSRKPVIPPRVVAVLSFGFWVSLLGPGPSGLYEMRLWRPILHHAFPHAKLPRKDVHHPLTSYGCCATGSPIMNPFLHGRWRMIIRASSRYSPGYAPIPPPGLPITAPSRLSWQPGLSRICGTARSCHPHLSCRPPYWWAFGGVKGPTLARRLYLDANDVTDEPCDFNNFS